MDHLPLLNIRSQIQLKRKRRPRLRMQVPVRVRDLNTGQFPSHTPRHV